jgi:hypothetical protein
MIIFEPNRLTQALAAFALALIPFTVLAMWGADAFWPAGWSPTLTPLVLLAEVGLFVALLTSQRQVRSILPSVVIAVAAISVRAACSFASASTVWLLGSGDAPASLGARFMELWMGSPVVIAIQLAITALALPIALHTWAPGFLSQRSLAMITSATAPKVLRRPDPLHVVLESGVEDENSSSTAMPYVSSLLEFEKQCEQVVGLEGFMILNAEGLIIWSNLPWDDDPEEIAAGLSRWLIAGSGLTHPGATRLRAPEPPKVGLLNDSHSWVSSTSMAEGPTLHLFYAQTFSPLQVLQSSPRLAEAARAMLAYRLGSSSSAKPNRVPATHGAVTQAQEEQESWNLSLKS